VLAKKYILKSHKLIKPFLCAETMGKPKSLNMFLLRKVIKFSK